MVMQPEHLRSHRRPGLPHWPIRSSPSSRGSDESEGSRRYQLAVESGRPSALFRLASTGLDVGLAKVLDLSFVFIQNRTVEARERRSALHSARYRADGQAVVSMAAEVMQ